MAEHLIDVAEARKRVLEAATPLPPEPVPLEEVLGRVLAEDVVARDDLPPFASSAMDGFALVAGPAATLVVVGESRAGRPATRRLAAGEAIRISTGAVIPDGADTVVPVERVEEREERVSVPEWPADRNIRRAGEDIRAGETVMSAGRGIGPAEVAVLASMGRAQVRCGGRPRVAVLSTGDELVEPGEAEALGPGQIRNSNAYAIAAQARRAGATVVGRAIVADDRHATSTALSGAIGAADVVCVSGGVSVGPHDHVKPVLAELGVRELFWGVRLKPGKPTWFGKAPAGTLVFGLPGNPVSAMVTFHLFARPALRGLAGAEPDASRSSAVLDAAVARNPRRDEAIRCRLVPQTDGWHALPTKEQGSHVLTSMLDADGLAIVPAGEGELAAGERVAVELLQ